MIDRRFWRALRYGDVFIVEDAGYIGDAPTISYRFFCFVDDDEPFYSLDKWWLDEDGTPIMSCDVGIGRRMRCRVSPLCQTEGMDSLWRNFSISESFNLIALLTLNHPFVRMTVKANVHVLFGIRPSYAETTTKETDLSHFIHTPFPSATIQIVVNPFHLP